MKRAVSLIISFTILFIIIYRIKPYSLLAIFKDSSITWMCLALAMFVPTVLMTAFRFKILVPPNVIISQAEAIKLILAGSSLNMVLPSKMGDIAKGYFVKEKAGIDLASSLSIVIYEKACDVLSLLLWCVLGLFFLRQKDLLFFTLAAMVLSGLIIGVLMIGSERFAMVSLNFFVRIAPKKIQNKIEGIKSSWIGMCGYLKRDTILMLKVAGISIAIWFLHLIQIWFCIRMLNANIPMWSHLALTPMAIFAGLLPLTYAGIGTRDAALIYFLKPYLSVNVAAALGLLCTLRYIIPAVAGLPFLSKYMIHFNHK
ncbi:MAG: lysylphosphatidylglycerol synthase transmembrane domain-containing protein [Desulfatitalea sp.]